MTKKTIGLDDRLYQYLHEISLREPEILQKLRDETEELPMSVMQVSPEQGQFMGFLVRLMGAKKTLDIGVFTGYSSLAVALALPPGGKVVGCDTSEEYTAIARRYWQDAGVEDKVDLYLAPALETLDRLIEEGQGGTFDFAFIDADKNNYGNYFDRALELLRPGGLIAVDNVLWSGKVAEPDEQDNLTTAIRNFNQRVYSDERVDISLVPIADGLTLALKR
ncbi:class I SAM-dependent methyltransferase [Lusitaniella coriacea]|uniref:class I SAM-dependent methyltransferase n=1 Tax=Lusitaniella coriacea TaxID=1983105 RepID=UPI003CF917F8